MTHTGGRQALTGDITIDLTAVADNYKALRTRVAPHVSVAGVVKANAYGLGLQPIAHTLMRQGCTTFFVATLDEGVALQSALSTASPVPRSAVTVYVLDGFHPDGSDLYLQHALIPVLNSIPHIQAYSALASTHDTPLPAALQLDTGMHRLGLSADDLPAFQRLSCPGISWHLILSHLASADLPDATLNATQYSAFTTALAQLPALNTVPRSLANSSGVFLGPDYHCNLVRPGMALYGLNPTPAHSNPMTRVVTVRLPVVQTHTIPSGRSVGYNATYHCTQPTAALTLGAGYADGLFRSLSNRGAVYVHGIRCPIIGRVSMDLTTVDVSKVPPAHRPCAGDLVEWIGPSQSPCAVGADAGSFAYEVLTGLSRRFKRHYLQDSPP